jgi:NAD(P)-dependent dehydrogenase (short-subunit alcohol dehydrogenase family)
VGSPIPLQLSTPPNILDNAYAVLFLASDESRYINGVILPATDGGSLSKVSIPFDDNWKLDQEVLQK